MSDFQLHDRVRLYPHVSEGCFTEQELQEIYVIGAFREMSPQIMILGQGFHHWLNESDIYKVENGIRILMEML